MTRKWNRHWKKRPIRMEYEEILEIPNGIAEEAKECVKTAGVKGLSLEKATELGCFDRISYLTCVFHSCVCVAYRIFGQVDYLLTEMGGKRHEIKQACNKFEEACDKFIAFWKSGGYQTTEGIIEMNQEIETLYHQVMRWAQIPEVWQLGDPQHIEDDADVLLRVELPDKTYKFHRTLVDSEALADVEENYCVTKLSLKEQKQVTVEMDMDKASAQMVAKRLSAEDPENIYTASMLQTISEKRVEIAPVKAYKANKVVGSVRKVFKPKKAKKID